MNITSVRSSELFDILADPSIPKRSEGRTVEEMISNANKRDTFERDKYYDTSSIEALMGGFDSAASPMYLKAALGMNDNEIAEHVGGIGKRLDEAYANGRVTKEEYDELNTSLNDYAVNLTNRCKRSEASRAIIKQEGTVNLQRLIVGFEDNRTVDEILAERNSAIEAYLEEHTVDMNMIFHLINNVRYGAI